MLHLEMAVWRFVVCAGLALAGLISINCLPQQTFSKFFPQQTGSPARTPDVPYVPTPNVVVEEMLRTAGVKAGDMVYDLGCGDGRIVVAAARDFGARAVGIDIDPQRIAESNANARAAGVAGRVRFVEGDLFTADFSEATALLAGWLDGRHAVETHAAARADD